MLTENQSLFEHDTLPVSQKRPSHAGIETKTQLRFMTCGSVDDGKSTLIGRLLYDTTMIFDDQLAALKRDSHKFGSAGEDLDFALLVDGLEAEREQGITIDVAYRFFATDRRRFIVADTPGHEEFTRNMATGASNSDLAVLLVDARQGLLSQTKRHSIITSILGIRHIVLVVNKIDLVSFDAAVFNQVAGDFRLFARSLGIESVGAIPVSARFGDNVTMRSERTPWYSGPSLIEYLEEVDVEENDSNQPFRFPVQYVVRPNETFRGFAGTIASGRIAQGETVIVAKSQKRSRIKRIVTMDGDLDEAVAGQAITLVLEDEVELSRGNLLTPLGDGVELADQFAAEIVWFDEKPMVPGRSYILQTETDQVIGHISELKYRINVNSLAEEPAASLALNEIALCNVAAQTPIAFDTYSKNRATGAFVLIDRRTNATVGAGMIKFPLRRATNVHRQPLSVSKERRAALTLQRPVVIWLTGLSGAGKSTIANLLESKLHARGHYTYLLDGDNVRHGLNKDLGFSEPARVENIRRVAEVARLMVDAGLIVIVSLISPFRAERQMARELFGTGEFIEVFVDTPLEDCSKRDPKGLYAKALRGEIANFTGIGSVYEPPDSPDVHLKTTESTAEELATTIETWLSERRYC
ncbi:sulfate adenylyltransferase subunit CysN [Agrobacterium tumefaciens]|uniref:Multifunctional fusion protein n=1 Tax=Agrobacterium tumefaciens TaxID=358 RepID=A0A1S6WDS3_AGRTU|nr:bifunctional ATP sulfurylase (ATPS) / adenosine 5'-phosphosulfate kinase (APSK) [Agrobacterium radiobacter]OMP71414.1 adenylyl-sulfate kinase [Agrobacterium tumefaciens]